MGAAGAEGAAGGAGRGRAGAEGADCGAGAAGAGGAAGVAGRGAAGPGACSRGGAGPSPPGGRWRGRSSPRVSPSPRGSRGAGCAHPDRLDRAMAGMTMPPSSSVRRVRLRSDLVMCLALHRLFRPSAAGLPARRAPWSGHVSNACTTMNVGCLERAASCSGCTLPEHSGPAGWRQARGGGRP